MIKKKSFLKRKKILEKKQFLFFMKVLKTQPLLSILNSNLIDSPSPSNLSYLWNYGSLLGVCLVIQIITGVTLAMHFCPNIDLAFNSVEHITIFHMCSLNPNLC